MVTKYDPHQVGVWNIFGEDPNCDLGGYHSNPFLGVAEGTYADVLEYAKTLDGWFQWGGGGYLELRTEPKVVKVNAFENARRSRLAEEKDRLLTRISEIDEEMKR